MKKGIVMEQHRKFTIVMTQDGLFEKAHPIKDAEIGFEVNYKPVVQKDLVLIFKGKFFTMRVAALVFAFLIALLPLYMVTNGNEAYAYVDIDINPSIELEIDNDLEVSDVTPYNDDAKLLLEEVGDLKGKDVEEAIEIIMSKSEEKGLINAAKNVLIGVYYLNDQEQDPVVEVMIEKHFAQKPSDWQVVTVSIPEEVRSTAKENKESMNLTLAKTVANQTEKRVNPIVTEEDNEVLQSFFNTNKTEVEVTNEDSSKNKDTEEPSIATEKGNEKGNSHNDEVHPSYLKNKNGEINSNKNNNGRHNGKANGPNKDHHKNHMSDYNNGKNKDKHHHNNGKNKDDVDKAKKKDHKKDKHNGKGNNGKNNDKGNGKDHRKNGNKGKGNENKNNKHDDFSYSFPLY